MYESKSGMDRRGWDETVLGHPPQPSACELKQVGWLQSRASALCVHAGLGLRLGIAHPQTRRIAVPLTLGIRGKLRIASTPHQAAGDVPRAADGVWISASVPDGPHRRHGPLGSWDNLWVRHSRCGLPHALWVRHTLSAWFSGELGFRMLFG